MIDALSRWRPRRASYLIFALAGIAACSGQSCSCIAPIPGGFPPSQLRENGIQARFTSSFLTYVSKNAPTIVPNLLPGGETFNIPESCGGSTEICCATPAPVCQMQVVPTALTLTPNAPNVLHFSANIIARSLENLPISTDIGDCNVSFDTTRSGATFLTATGDMTFTVDSTTKLTQLSLVNPSIDGIDDGDVNLDEAGSDDQCAIANVDIIEGFIIDYIEDQVADIVTTAVQGELCQSCTDISDCPSGATACTNMQCIGPDKTTCIQQLGIQGRANLGASLSSFSPGLSAYVDIMEAAGGYANTDTGLSIGIIGGAQADPHNACVPVVAAPTAVDVAPSMSFAGDVVPGTTTPYEVGIGLNIAHLTQLGYAFWDSGGLCLSAGSSTITALSAKTLELIMPSIADLIHGDDAPVLIKLRPQMPPTFVLGLGTFTESGGVMKVDQPLVTMTAPSLALDLYLLVDNRYARIATVTGDLALPLGLETDATGAFVIVPGDLSKPLTNVAVTNSDLLAETKADLEAAFPGLVSLAIGPLVSALPTLSLPTLAGLSIMPQVITSTDQDSTGAYDFLAVYSNVAAATTAQQAFDTSARLLSVSTPPTQVFDIDHRDGRVPSVTVAVDNAGVFEWSWRFDNGFWNAFQTAPQLTLTDPALWLQGKHTVALRGRFIGQPQSLDASPVELPFIIDSEAPTGTFALAGGHVVVTAHDRISADEALRYRIGDGAFVTPAQLGVVVGDPTKVTIQVRDEAGNIGVLTYAGGDVPKAAGCDVGRGSPVSLLALVVVLGLLFRRRVLLACALLVGCHHGDSKSSELDPTDVIGQMHDVQGFGTVLHVSAYDQKYGDLGYATFEVSDLTTPPAWTIVDGVDETSPKDGTSPYRGKHTTAGPDTGFYSSLALTSSGKPRIAYWDTTNHALKFASGPYPFKSHAVDTGMADGSVEIGTFPSIVLDASDTPAIAYAATGMGDETSGFTSELRVARAKTQTPESASDWTITTVDTVAISCAGRCATGEACIVDAMVNGVANTNPVHSTCTPIDVAPCTPVCSSSDVCIGSVCTSVAATIDGDLPQGTGLFTKLLLGPSSQLAIAYYDRSNAALKVAIVSASNTFVPQTLDGGMTGEDFGQQVNAAYDSSGTLHLAYVDDVLGQLDYRELTGTGTLSARVVIDDGLRDDGPHLVGASASVLVNSTGTSVLYQDQTTSQLQLASGTSSGFSHAPFQTTEDGVGFSSHQIALSSVPYYSTWRVDRTATPFGHVELGTIQ